MHVIKEKINCLTAQKHISTSSSQCLVKQIIMKRGHDCNRIHHYLFTTGCAAVSSTNNKGLN